ncbi:MAG: response regulator [Alphaproteobacteria bacterium]|nr:response regulator [Alphaproteobacteria bacterium]
MPPPETWAPQIFVAEDDRGVLDLLRTRLTVAGYQVGYARDGRDALQGITARPPHAVLLDVNLPELDGFGVLKALKANTTTARVPVMMMTARQRAEDVRTAIALGANDYLAKPFRDEVLLLRLTRLLRARVTLPSPPDDVAPSPPDDVVLL